MANYWYYAKCRKALTWINISLFVTMALWKLAVMLMKGKFFCYSLGLTSRVSHLCPKYYHSSTWVLSSRNYYLLSALGVRCWQTGVAEITLFHLLYFRFDTGPRQWKTIQKVLSPMLPLWNLEKSIQVYETGKQRELMRISILNCRWE